MLSMAIAVSFFTLIFPLLGLLIKSISASTAYEELSVRQFFIHFRDEMIEAEDYTLNKQRDQITLHLDYNRKANFLLFGKDVIRRIDGGFEVYLKDVSQLSFEPLSYGVKVKIVTVKGGEYEKEIILYP